MHSGKIESLLRELTGFTMLGTKQLIITLFVRLSEEEECFNKNYSQTLKCSPVGCFIIFW